jgi:hypothetical protein
MPSLWPRPKRTARGLVAARTAAPEDTLLVTDYLAEQVQAVNLATAP